MKRWDKQLATPLPCIPGDLVTVNRAGSSMCITSLKIFRGVRF